MWYTKVKHLNNFELILCGGMKSHAGGRNWVTQELNALGLEGGLDLLKVSAAMLGDPGGCFEALKRAMINLRNICQLKSSQFQQSSSGFYLYRRYH